MMLREGWDVKNVTVVLGLRPFTAKAEIPPEQVIGRGLRLIPDVSPDRTQTLEVLGTRNLLNVLRTQLEAEGVGVTTTKTDPMLRINPAYVPHAGGRLPSAGAGKTPQHPHPLSSSATPRRSS
jgi:type III restriction enzyme